MEIIEVTPEFFDQVVSHPFHVYGSAAFAMTNSDKAERIHFLLFKDTKYRSGLIAGRIGNKLYSPFSAPFGGFLYLSREIKIIQIEESVRALLEWARAGKSVSLNLVLPPACYEKSFIAKQANVLFRSGFSLSRMDLNYSLYMKDNDRDYLSGIWSNARNKLNHALENHLNFSRAETPEEKSEAFQIIRKNREARQFALNMSWERVEATIHVVPADFFLVSTEKQEKIGAAMVFGVSGKVRQVIYWGDIPEYSHLKTMNFLAYMLYNHYRNSGIELLDIGPATDENSVPYYGLSDFKESIGCDVTEKLTFRYDF